MISAFVAYRLLHKGCVGYLAHIVDTWVEEMRLEDITVVKKISDVFPDDLSGLPSERELDFAINSILGTNLISLSPYRMAPA